MPHPSKEDSGKLLYKLRRETAFRCSWRGRAVMRGRAAEGVKACCGGGGKACVKRRLLAAGVRIVGGGVGESKGLVWAFCPRKGRFLTQNDEISRVLFALVYKKWYFCHRKEN